MTICKVIGHVWATKKEEHLEGLKLMVVQEQDGPNKKRNHVAVDVVGAGIGELVLVVSGSTARSVFESRGTGDLVPTDMAIVGIIDNLEIQRDSK